MKDKPKIHKYQTLASVATKLRGDLSGTNVVLLYAFNRTGKTRLSMEFKDRGKKSNKGAPDTLYFNAFTEDLFVWNNDLENDQKRFLKLNEKSKFFSGFKGLALESRIRKHLERFAQFDFKIDYDEWVVSFNKEIPNPQYNPFAPHNQFPEKIIQDNIKISRGEENIFIFSVFLSICELAIEGKEEYNFVKFIYVDDPISSLDENNVITLACDLSSLIKEDLNKYKDGIPQRKYIISTHHSLFFNLVYNELKKEKSKTYFLYKTKEETYKLQATDDSPFFHHIEQLCELNQRVKKYEEREKNNSTVVQSSILKTYHFNELRAILEKTALFFGHGDISYCLKDFPDKDLFDRALNIMSHGKYSIFSPVGMMKENADLFVNIFHSFVSKYNFELPEIFFE